MYLKIEAMVTRKKMKPRTRLHNQGPQTVAHNGNQVYAIK